MLSIFRSSWALFIGIGLLMIGNSMQGTLLGIRGSLENFNPTVMGFVMAAYFIGFLGGSWLTPGLIRNVGHVRVFAALASLISAAFIIYAVFVNPWAWALMRLIVGFGFSGVYVVAESWVNNAADNEHRGQALSAYMIVQMVGIVIGQALINLSSPGGYDLFILMSVLVSISFAPILLSAAPAPVAGASERMSITELLQSSPLGCVGSMLLGGIFSALFGMAVVYAGELEFSVETTSAFVSSIYIGGMLMQYPIGWISDRMDRRRVIMIVTILGTGACVLGILGAPSKPALFVAAFVLGGVANPLYSLLIAHTNDYLPASKMASASSGLVFLNGLGAMFGPVTVGYMMQVFGPNGFFLFNAVLCAIIATYAGYRMTQRAAVSPDDTGSYIPVPARSLVGAEVAAEIYSDEVIENENEGDGGERNPSGS
jgi:MFS family permease